MSQNYALKLSKKNSCFITVNFTDQLFYCRFSAFFFLMKTWWSKNWCMGTKSWWNVLTHMNKYGIKYCTETSFSQNKWKVGQVWKWSNQKESPSALMLDVHIGSALKSVQFLFHFFGKYKSMLMFPLPHKKQQVGGKKSRYMNRFQIWYQKNNKLCKLCGTNFTGKNTKNVCTFRF